MPWLAFIEILILLYMIARTMYLFWPISKPATYLLIPYLAWVTFATALTLAIAILN
jgi:tryptophan-rich sensory protein